LERSFDFLAPCAAIGGMFDRRSEQCSFVGDECACSTAATRADRATPIHQDAKQPGREPLRIFAPRQRSICPRERVLKRFFGVFAIAEHVHRISRVSVAVSLDQSAECFRIPAQHALNDYSV
jgi:hypothetical protein